MKFFLLRFGLGTFFLSGAVVVVVDVNDLGVRVGFHSCLKEETNIEQSKKRLKLKSSIVKELETVQVHSSNYQAQTEKMNRFAEHTH